MIIRIFPVKDALCFMDNEGRCFIETKRHLYKDAFDILRTFGIYVIQEII